MKATIGKIEISGTVEEMARFAGLVNQPIKTHTTAITKRKYTKKLARKNKPWTNEEQKFLEANVDKKNKVIAKTLHRTSKAINARISSMKLR